MKAHVTLKTGVMMLKIQICHYWNKLHFKIYNSNRKQLFCNSISQYYVFLITKVLTW